MNVWTILDIRATRDIGDIRRAYAKRLKTIDQRTEQAAFQNLRAAYETALNMASQAAARDAAQASSVPATTAEAATAVPSNPVSKDGAGPAAAPVATVDPRPQEIAPAPLAPEPDPDPRALEWARAEALVQLFASTLQHAGEEEALEVFRKTMASEELQSFSLRDTVEWHLIFALANTKQIPLGFVSAVMNFFGWHDRPDLLETGAAPALRSLLARRTVQAKYEELLERANRNRYSARFTGDLAACQAARALLSTYSPWRARWQARSASVIAEVRRLLAELDLDAPAVLDSFLDAKTVAYWRRVTEIPPLSFGVLASAAIVGFFATAIFFPDINGPRGLAAMAFMIVLTIGVFAVISRARHYWRRTWRARMQVWSAIALERSVARTFPHAVRAGLGWKEILKTLVFAPFLAMIGAGALTDMEPYVGPLYLPLLLLASVVLIFSMFVLLYQIKHWKAVYTTLPPKMQRRWQIGGLALVFICVGAAMVGEPTPLAVLILLALFNYVLSPWRR